EHETHAAGQKHRPRTRHAHQRDEAQGQDAEQKTGPGIRAGSGSWVSGHEVYPPEVWEWFNKARNRWISSASSSARRFSLSAFSNRVGTGLPVLTSSRRNMSPSGSRRNPSWRLSRLLSSAGFRGM